MSERNGNKHNSWIISKVNLEKNFLMGFLKKKKKYKREGNEESFISQNIKKAILTSVKGKGKWILIGIAHKPRI